MNGDEALRCCDIARNALNSATKTEDLDKAERFASKALKLDPSCGAATALRELIDAKRKAGFSGDGGGGGGGTNGTASSGGRSNGGSGGGSRGGSGEAAANDASSAPPPKKKGTPEQEKLIAKIKKAGSDYYEVLGLSRGANDAEVKKAYRKLALKLHPDKCQAAGAEECFKTVSRAFACLSDPNKRAAFDRYGSEEPSAAGFGPGMRRRNGGAGMNGFGFEDDIDPADIFNMFFNGGMPGGMGGFGGPGFRVHTFGGNPFTHQHRARAHARHDPRVDDSATVIRNILHLLPLLIPLLMYFLSPGEEVYSMIRTKEHPNLLKTQRMELPFYANEKTFRERYSSGRELEAMERRIENEFVMYKRRQCDYERSRWMGKRPNCEYLQELQKKYPQLNVYSPW